MTNFLVVVECAIYDNGRFLIIKRPPGVHAENLLSFPGGKVEYSDGNIKILENAVKREILEEVGINLLDPIKYVTSNYFTNSENTNVLDILFYCSLDKTLNKIIPDPIAVPKYYWLTYSEIIKKENCPDWLRLYLHHIEQHINDSSTANNF